MYVCRIALFIAYSSVNPPKPEPFHLREALPLVIHLTQVTHVLFGPIGVQRSLYEKLGIMGWVIGPPLYSLIFCYLYVDECCTRMY